MTFSQLGWHHSPRTLTLPKGEVHVWRAPLDLDSIELQRAVETLASEERARASRFHFHRHRRHFIATHAILRRILARYLDCEPARLEFCNGPWGKPELAPGSKANGIRFNSSRSRGVALYAVSRHHDVGVDVEWVCPDFAWQGIADQFFAAREGEALRAVPAASQSEAFFNCWTRKEAVVKASGEGFSLPLDRFEVSLLPGERARLLHVAGDSLEASRWSIRELEPAAGYVAAVALRAHGWKLRLWESCGGFDSFSTAPGSRQ